MAVRKVRTAKGMGSSPARGNETFRPSDFQTFGTSIGQGLLNNEIGLIYVPFGPVTYFRCSCQEAGRICDVP